ncbi:MULTISPECIES: HPr family phosphocarrier protein [unclassified Psychrobacillus]|uniref:HPr family phosphocarrier protein n=1 Tax=unclassified Psychrobacillus TaxID=2636677 RepID=UPI00146CD3D7|nr:HPr family phosphocarrier protein [Psychrobacillus sp. BL-248-WT-3]NME06811.1 HPr family phosphocarrier protein [Psychrobacillus sp. BL-248-WT-3]
MERHFKVTATEGIHARPAAILVSAIKPFISAVELKYNGQSANLRSILSVMTLCVPVHAMITIVAEGDDSKELLDKLSEVIFSQGIGEGCEN